MSRARAWIALLAISHGAACSSTFKELSPTPSNGEPSGRAGPFLNSNFFIALETGLLVGGITQLYNWAKAKSDRKTAEDNALREKQINLLSSTAKDLPVYISTMGSMRKLKTWLEEHKRPEEKAEDQKDDLGRAHDDVLKEYSAFFKLLLETKNSAAILTEVSSFFEDNAVCEAVREEDRAIGRIHDAKNEPERAVALKAEGGTFEALLEAMAKEIRHRDHKANERGQRKDRCLGEIVASPPKP
jgi:hypothetical protein